MSNGLGSSISLSGRYEVLTIEDVLSDGSDDVPQIVTYARAVNAEIFLGQSFLSKFKSWSVDNEKHALVLR